MKYKIGDVVLIRYNAVDPPYNYYIGKICKTGIEQVFSVLTEVLNPREGNLQDAEKVYGWDSTSHKNSGFSVQQLESMTGYTGKFWFVIPDMILLKLDPAREDFDTILSIFSSDDSDGHNFMLEVLKNEKHIKVDENEKT